MDTSNDKNGVSPDLASVAAGVDTAVAIATVVVDDLPHTISLLAAELDAIESYCGPLLDELLVASPSEVAEAGENADSSGGDDAS